jgi:hypothetical protein
VTKPNRQLAAKRLAAAERASKMMRAKGRQLEAAVVLLPGDLPKGEKEILKNALCEAAGILNDAAERVVKPFAEVE